MRWAPGPGLMRWLGLSIPHGSVSMTLIAANLALYAITTLATMASPQDPGMAVSDAWGAFLQALRPLLFPSSEVLFHMGSMEPAAVLLGQVWRLWTYQFLHFGLIHIGFNMMALLSLGPTTEDVYGPWKTMVVYWATGVGAGLASMFMRFFSVGFGALAMDPHILLHRLPATVGASGSIFGLIGFLIGHTVRRRGTQSLYLRRILIQWAVSGFIMGLFIGADNAAHLGGLVLGFVLGLLVSDRRSLGSGLLAWRAAGIFVIVLIGAGFAAQAVLPSPRQAPWPGEPEARLRAPSNGFVLRGSEPARSPRRGGGLRPTVTAFDGSNPQSGLAMGNCQPGPRGSGGPEERNPCRS